MPKSDEVKDVNNGDGEDRVTADHDAGLGSSAEEMETHNPDIEDYDEILKRMEAEDDDEGDGDEDEASGGTKITDESKVDDDGGSGDDEGSGEDTGDGDGEEPKIPRSRLNEVIGQRDEFENSLHQKEVQWAAERAALEARLEIIEKSTAAEPKKDPLSEILSGEPQSVLDNFSENPAAFVNLIRQDVARLVDEGISKASTTQSQARQEEEYQKILSAGLDEFSEAHPEFISRLNDLVSYSHKNPIHNPISAYAYEVEIPALKSELEKATKDVETRIEAAKKEGMKLGKERVIKEIRAKGASSVLDGSQSVTDSGKANAGSDLETGGDPRKLREMLVAKLKQKRAAMGE